jgi:quercetin dioxygenase-like cupin family protein
MKATNLLEKLEFHEEGPHAEPLFVDKDARILRFTLKPGQSIREHVAPSSPFYLVVLRGSGLFVGGDGREQEFGPMSLLVFQPGEAHAIRARDEELVFVGFLHGAPTATNSDRVGGSIGRSV